MKTLKYIMKTSAQKIFNVKFATFCAAFLILLRKKIIRFHGAFFLFICPHLEFYLFFM